MVFSLSQPYPRLNRHQVLDVEDVEESKAKWTAAPSLTDFLTKPRGMIFLWCSAGYSPEATPYEKNSSWQLKNRFCRRSIAAYHVVTRARMKRKTESEAGEPGAKKQRAVASDESVSSRLSEGLLEPSVLAKYKQSYAESEP